MEEVLKEFINIYSSNVYIFLIEFNQKFLTFRLLHQISTEDKEKEDVMKVLNNVSTIPLQSNQSQTLIGNLIHLYCMYNLYNYM